MNHPQLIPCAHPFICVYEQFQCLLIVCTSHVLIASSKGVGFSLFLLLMFSTYQ